jgi:RNA recognition motif-containing protein
MEFKHWFINEENAPTSVEGLDNLIQQIKKSHPQIQESLINHIKQFIINSGTPKIEISNIRMALGASLKDRVIINSSVFSQSLSHILYVVFHEIAHQYQYKKHGFAEMFAYFKDQISTSEAVKILRTAENIADNYAIRKLKKLQKEGEQLDASGLYGYYAQMSDSILANYIQMVKQELKGDDVSNPEKISQRLWNIIRPR